MEPKNLQGTDGADRFLLYLNCGTKSGLTSDTYDPAQGEIYHLKSGTVEYRLYDPVINDGTQRVENRYMYPGYEFAGWHIRVKNTGNWFWYMENGAMCQAKNLPAGLKKYLLPPGEPLVQIPMKGFDLAVLEAVWAVRKGEAAQPSAGYSAQFSGEDIAQMPEEHAAQPRKGEIYRVLLLTNRDSDNLGDLVIEACDLSLIRTIMQNLGISEDRYRIESRAAGLVSKKYVATKDPALLASAEKTIENADLVCFGGAPLFNYRYQIFYERTAVTLELAQKHGKSVLFSAVGVEQYSETDAKCQRLKGTLNLDCVKQITTRDDFESLQKYITSPDIPIAKVADPAIFTREAFRRFLPERPDREKKMVGVFILRRGGFNNNGIHFSKNEAAQLWLDLIADLTEKGYDYTLLTSGHFGDEAFLDCLTKDYGVKAEKCVFHPDSPEKLVQLIAGFDAVVSCRLHPSIISYSLGVPAVGIVWNAKVQQFYESIHYADRVVQVVDSTPRQIAQGIANRIDQIVGTEVVQEEAFRMSVYRTLFDGFRRDLEHRGLIEEGIEPYSCAELMKRFRPAAAMSREEKDQYLIRKLRRTYEKYNAGASEEEAFELVFHSGTKNGVSSSYDESQGRLRHLNSGSSEYRLRDQFSNTGQVPIPNRYEYPGHTFLGWHMRVKKKDKWYWYLEDGSFSLQTLILPGTQKMIITEEKLPYLAIKGVSVVVLEAVWDPKDPPQKKSLTARVASRLRRG